MTFQSCLYQHHMELDKMKGLMAPETHRLIRRNTCSVAVGWGVMSGHVYLSSMSHKWLPYVVGVRDSWAREMFWDTSPCSLKCWNCCKTKRSHMHTRTHPVECYIFHYLMQIRPLCRTRQIYWEMSLQDEIFFEKVFGRMGAPLSVFKKPMTHVPLYFPGVSCPSNHLGCCL